ncbi:MAG TPA: DUF1801 domain-containing protein [Methylocella sp.]|jgi:hypothetical protein|nr:DUF1801 domain-containing protein [Methylocella sp.]
MNETSAEASSVVAKRTSKKSAKVAKKATAKRVDANAAKPQGSVAKSSARKSTNAAANGLPAHYAVPKSEGDGAVHAWIDLLPDWQTDRARRIDAVVTREVQNVHKAVKWHGIWYGVPGHGWFLAIGSLKAHLKLVLFDGANLTPLPPVHLATKPTRALDLRERDTLDEAQLADWVRQASQLPGWGKA